MKRTHEKSSQPVTSPKPTTLNLQTRAFSPTSLDSSQVNRKPEDALEQFSNSTSENLLGKLIPTPSDSADNHSIQRKSLHRFPIQAKLNIGEPNDKYEKEADSTAAKVVQQINSPTQDSSIQRQEGIEEEDEELQMKPISKIQRQEGIEEEDEELQMKSLVQGQENLGGGEASSNLESSIQSARGSGKSLDSSLQAKIGQAMGADFSGVKIHTDSQSDQLNKSIQAKAFTTGQDIFFRQGAYDPISQSGQELIAHELTHVVQQNADMKNLPIQRLMQTNAFQTITPAANDNSVFSKGRNKIKPIDRALTNYHLIQYESGMPKVQGLQLVINECNTYLNLSDKKAKRKQGVRTLLQEANNELPIVQNAANVFALPDDVNKVKQAVILQDQIVNDLFVNPNDSLKASLNAALSDVMASISNKPNILSKQDKRTLMQDDIDRLTNMSNDQSLPQITRDIITEILGHLGLIDLTTGAAGSGYTNKGPQDPKYFVMNNMKAKGGMGTGERIAALTHELSHVAVAESYGNSKMLWSFAINLSDQAIINLSTKREGQLNQLLALIDGIPNLGANQKSLLRQQLEYAKRPNLQADKNALTQDEIAKFNRLETAGVNWSTLVEMDPNINQCLVLMASWGVANNEPFHTMLQQVATEAKDERDNA